MSKWRLAVVALLIAGPCLFLMGYGGYQLWLSGLSFWVWWPMMASLAAAYILGWYWQKRQKLLRIDFTPQLHWTDRDRQAWQLVEQRAKSAEKVPSDNFMKFSFYTDVAQEMALEMARFYHPNAQDPFSSLTLPEILAVIELASHDLAEMVDKYLPGGHLMTINDWKTAKQATDWYQTASALYWAVSAVFSPVNTVTRYLASQVGVSRPLAMLQQNLLLWFYTAFLQRMGTYLIDLNSGRLRVGADRYRKLMSGVRSPASGVQNTCDATEIALNSGHRTQDAGLSPDTGHRTPDAGLCIGMIGQVKAGKSSLVNALLGQQRARTNVLPETQEITRYDLRLEGSASRLEILDTVGYSHSGPREDQLAATQNAARQSDVLILALHARTGAREPDVQLCKALRKWFDSRPDLKMPPLVGVLTHIDLLSPAMEWQPPYHWQQPARVKEQQIAEAVQEVREQFGEFLAAVVPVCVAEGRVYGVEEWLLPTLVGLLDEGRAVGMLRCLRAEVDARKIRKVFEQLLAAGKEAATVLLSGKR
jgi:uncharacterized protein